MQINSDGLIEQIRFLAREEVRREGKKMRHAPTLNENWFDIVECCLDYTGTKDDLAGIFSCLDDMVFLENNAVINAQPEAIGWRPRYRLDSWEGREEMLISRGYLRDDWRYGREPTGQGPRCLYMSMLRQKDVLAAEEMAREIYRSDLPFVWTFGITQRHAEDSPFYAVSKGIKGIKDVVALGVLPVLSKNMQAIIMDVPGIIV